MLFPATWFYFHRPVPVLTCFRIISTGVRCFGRQSERSSKPPVGAPTAGTPAMADPESAPRKWSESTFIKKDLPRRFSRENPGAKNKYNHRHRRKLHHALPGADKNYE